MSADRYDKLLEVKTYFNIKITAKFSIELWRRKARYDEA